jgi:uncharacterized protein (TIGR02452 family)
MSNTSDNRSARSRLAEETLSILEKGYYNNAKGARIQIQEEVTRAVEGSKLYAPAELLAIKRNMEAKVQSKAEQSLAVIEVTGETTLQAAYRLVTEDKKSHTVCLNFASAKNPGGGFRGGSQAQEESLARSSALYPCISQMQEMYDYNKRLKTCLYSDYIIFSPDVTVFRNDQGDLLDEPYQASFTLPLL